MSDYALRTEAYLTARGPENSLSFLPAIGLSPPRPPSLRRSYSTLQFKPNISGSRNNTHSTECLSSRYSSDPELRIVNHVLPDVCAGHSVGVGLSLSARNAVMTRFSPQDWHTSNQTSLLTSDKTRSLSERVRLDTTRMCREMDDKTKRTQNDVGKKLGHRLDDLEYWKNEVNNELDGMIAEINALSRMKGYVEDMSHELEEPLRIVQECLYNREKRQGIDLVHDSVEKALIKETDGIKKSQQDLKRILQELTNQMTLNRGVQHELEKDSADKQIASRLDNVCHQMNNSSRTIQYYDGIEKVDNTCSVYDTWLKFSYDNINRSRIERSSSRRLRAETEALLNSISQAVLNQWNMVNQAFTERMREYVDARNKIQLHLSKTLQEIMDMERNTELIKRCILEKEGPLHVAQTRLATRIRRPNVEACKDHAQHRLIEEVHEISETVNELRAQLRTAQHTQQRLLCIKSNLEQDLDIKNNSIYIDRERCLGIRKACPLLSKVGSY